MREQWFAILRQRHPRRFSRRRWRRIAKPRWGFNRALPNDWRRNQFPCYHNAVGRVSDMIQTSRRAGAPQGRARLAIAPPHRERGRQKLKQAFQKNAHFFWKAVRKSEPRSGPNSGPGCGNRGRKTVPKSGPDSGPDFGTASRPIFIVF